MVLLCYVCICSTL